MNLTEAAPLLLKYRTKGVLLDTNLLLLLLAGQAGPHILQTFKPTRNHGFSEQDFNLLKRIVKFFPKIIITPHILTEVSNHSGKLTGELRHGLFETIARFARHCHEEFRRSDQLCVREEFHKFGLTDTAISALGTGKYLVLTVDLPLAGHLKKQGIDVINFNNLRALNLN